MDMEDDLSPCSAIVTTSNHSSPGGGGAQIPTHHSHSHSRDHLNVPALSHNDVTRLEVLLLFINYAYFIELNILVTLIFDILSL